MSKFPTPRNEYVILKIDEVEKLPPAPAGGFEVPDELKDKPKTATVMIASKGYYAKDTGVFIPIELQPNDRVLYNAFPGAPISLNGESYWLLKEGDIILKL